MEKGIQDFMENMASGKTCRVVAWFPKAGTVCNHTPEAVKYKSSQYMFKNTKFKETI